MCAKLRSNSIYTALVDCHLIHRSDVCPDIDNHVALGKLEAVQKYCLRRIIASGSGLQITMEISRGCHRGSALPIPVHASHSSSSLIPAFLTRVHPPGRDDWESGWTIALSEISFEISPSLMVFTLLD